MNIWLIISIILYVLQVATGILYFKNKRLRDEYERLLAEKCTMLAAQNELLRLEVQTLLKQLREKQ